MLLAVRAVCSRTKLHTRTDAQGLAIGFCLTPGQASDMAAYEELMQEEALNPAAMLADKGYDSDAIRDDLQRRGAEAVIPTKSNRKVQHPVDKARYALPNRIERFINRLKHSRRIATRRDSWPPVSSASSNSPPSDTDQVCPRELAKDG